MEEHQRKQQKECPLSQSPVGESAAADCSWTSTTINSLSSSSFFLKKSCPDTYEPTSSKRMSSSARKSASEEFPMCNLRFAKGKLYGRQQQIELLQDAVEWAVSSSSSSVLLVSGSSGVGKTSLVSKLQELPMMKKQQQTSRSIIFVQGKYGLQSHQLPYSALTEACRQLCEHLLSSKPSNQCTLSLERQEELKTALGSSIYILANLLPMVLPLVGLADVDDDNTQKIESNTQKRVDDASAQNRFMFALVTFLRIVANWTPVVMLLDDMQWADTDSFRLLRGILQNNRTQKPGILVLIGCYRSDEVDENHPASEWIRDMESTKKDYGFDLVRIVLSNLSVEALEEMLTDLLNTASTDKKTTELARLIHRKTLGNAFFVKQFLIMLHEKDLLTFSLFLMKWTWTFEEVEAKTSSTDNVVDLMKKKMQDLPRSLCETLPLAACLGSHFSLRLISVLVSVYQEERDRASDKDQPPDTGVTEWTDWCLREGFITEMGEGAYCWVHDKVQEAALGLVAAATLGSVQYKVGRILQEKLTPTEISENIFLVAGLLNQFQGSLSSMQAEKRLEIAKLNLAAGKAAMASASFFQAAVFLTAGIRVSPENHWSNHYSFSLELFSCAAEAYFYSSDHEHAEKICRAVLEQTADNPMMDKIRAYNVLIPLKYFKNPTNDDASDITVEVLAGLGCAFPKRGKMIALAWGIMGLKGGVRKLRSLRRHKKMEDPSRQEAMKLLDKLISIAYHTGSILCPLSILKMFRWTTRYGTSEFSPVAMAHTGMILKGILGDFPNARWCANYALSLFETSSQFDAVKPRVLYCLNSFILHAFMPAQNCLKAFVECYKSALVIGDVETAFFAIWMYLEFSFHLGKGLEALGEDWALFTKQMESYGQLRPNIQARRKWQVARNLMGLSDDPFVLKGDVFSIDTMSASSVDTLTTVNTYINLVDLAHFMCDDENGAKTVAKYSKMLSDEDLLPAAFLQDVLFARSAILCYAAMRKTGKKKYMPLGKKYHQHIKMIGRKGNPNFTYFDKLLDAELAALKGNQEVARKCYVDSISLAARRGLVSEQAVANERFADYLVACGDLDLKEASFYYDAAIRLYAEWGAKVKVEKIQEKMATKSKLVSLDHVESAVA